tara:strand:+ start:4986 stop:6041 length:1056 start_codon:yes stop_codon:yes gene_type:complete
MARIALYGGSFNPPHQGHLDVLKWLVADCPLDLEEIWVIPTVIHAFAKELLDYDIRERMVTAMLDKAFRSGLTSKSHIRDRIKVVRREEVFTADLLANLTTENPGDTFMPVMGADILHESDEWERWGEILSFKPIFVARVGVDVSGSGQTVHQIDAADPSSTDVRSRLAEGDLSFLVGAGADVPESVMSIIEKEGLYGFTKPDHGPCEVTLDTVYIPVETITDRFVPGVVFRLIGDIRKVLAVRTQNKIVDGHEEDGVRYCFAFTVLRDTDVVRETEQEIRSWQRARTLARTKGEEFTTDRPIPAGPEIVFLKLGDEPIQGLPGEFLGQADECFFFAARASRGLFGGLFGF